ncbi:hypothetical protein AXY43_16100 [Clostridium sp. MF28]|uniref:phage/plasmid replication domain-containing protein n=1 Tax=Clostridium TaxID=1485 RepID=UPI000CF931B4|nr:MULTISPECIES: phage/plasmid replication protein [Clostridium]AVK49398.1 hypothetical protein AXY43_16100 [Clostridium sp. MF28]PSM57984.1 hypothetical protein C4L39_09205 [Clostridium diolis]
MDTLILVLDNISIPEWFFKKNMQWHDFDKKDSLCYSLVYKNVHLQYLSYCNCLMLKVSITKFLYGANFKVLNASDINKFCFEINYILKQIFNKLNNNYRYSDLIDILEWKLNRLDLVSNFICNNDCDKKINLDIFKEAKYPYLKKAIYTTSIHDGNKSVRLNFYDKNAQVKTKYDNSILSLDDNLLRCEIQIKKGGINSLIRKGHLPGKQLKDIFCNIDKLNLIYADYLKKFGLFKEFLTSDNLDDFILELKNKNEISTRECKNIQAALVNKKRVSKNTLNKYIKIFNKYNVSHITVEKQSSLDFSNFELFKVNQFKKANDPKLLILIYLYILNFLIKNTLCRPIKILLTNLIRPLKLVKIYNDS